MQELYTFSVSDRPAVISIKTSFLKFFWCIDFVVSQDDGNSQLEIIGSFLQWANCGLNWKCLDVKFMLRLESASNPLMRNYMIKLVSFESTFSRKLRHLIVDGSTNLKRHCEGLTTLSATLLPNLFIKLVTDINDFREVSYLPFADRIKILQLRIDDNDPDLHLETVPTVIKKFRNAEKVILDGIELNIARALRCKNLRKLNFVCVLSDFSPFGAENLLGAVFESIEHLGVTYIDVSLMIGVSFANVFSI